MFCRNYLQFNRQFWYFVLFCRSALLCRFNLPQNRFDPAAAPFCSALPIQFTPEPIWPRRRPPRRRIHVGASALLADTVGLQRAAKLRLPLAAAYPRPTSNQSPRIYIIRGHNSLRSFWRSKSEFSDLRHLMVFVAILQVKILEIFVPVILLK